MNEQRQGKMHTIRRAEAGHADGHHTASNMPALAHGPSTKSTRKTLARICPLTCAMCALSRFILRPTLRRPSSAALSSSAMSSILRRFTGSCAGWVVGAVEAVGTAVAVAVMVVGVVIKTSQVRSWLICMWSAYLHVVSGYGGWSLWCVRLRLQLRCQWLQRSSCYKPTCWLCCTFVSVPDQLCDTTKSSPTPVPHLPARPALPPPLTLALPTAASAPHSPASHHLPPSQTSSQA